MSEAPVIRRHDDGSTTVDRDWPEEIQISAELLGAADGKVLEACVHFNVANGYAEYHLTSFDGRTYTARRVEGQWRPA